MAEPHKEAPEAETRAHENPIESQYHDDDAEIQADDVPRSTTHGIPVRKPRPKPMPKRRFVDD
jgi:hypothetical protein